MTAQHLDVPGLKRTSRGRGRPGSRPLERIDTMVIAGRRIYLVRATNHLTAAGTSVASLTLYRIPGGTCELVDSGMAWYGTDGIRGLECPSLGCTIAVHLPRRRSARPAAKVSHVLRRVTVGSAPGHDFAAAGCPKLTRGVYPGVYTRWPLMAESDPTETLELVSPRLAAGPAVLFRDGEDTRLVG